MSSFPNGYGVDIVSLPHWVTHPWDTHHHPQGILPPGELWKKKKISRAYTGLFVLMITIKFVTIAYSA
jgi:hypothetical protein